MLYFFSCGSYLTTDKLSKCDGRIKDPEQRICEDIFSAVFGFWNTILFQSAQVNSKTQKRSVVTAFEMQKCDHFTKPGSGRT